MEIRERKRRERDKQQRLKERRNVGIIQRKTDGENTMDEEVKQTEEEKGDREREVETDGGREKAD